MLVFIYFMLMEWFVDGGIIMYNNFIFLVIMEVVYYGLKGKYDFFELCVFSFGIGMFIEFIKLEDIVNLKGLDVFFWFDFVMCEFSQDVSDMQNNFICMGIILKMDFRRF